MEEALGMLRKRLAFAAARIGSYDPAHHDGGRVLRAVIKLTRVFAGRPAEEIFACSPAHNLYKA